MRLEESGSVCLRVDAAYCAVAAVCVGVFASPLGAALEVSAGFVAGAAVLTAGWAGLLLLAVSRLPLRASLLSVLAVNMVVVLLVGGLAVMRPIDAVSVLLLAVAAEVAAFAGWQAAVLRTSAH
ncbi:hypothetical protein [Streptomyces yokosukanensis]|uniref:hypothetical protein n=1 Tax=Streptomyces yokosukanensis TaxID=67386 RepID=UPI00131B4182|nr:hypothetical protein [Streptomyces yokosukanensis]